MSKKVKRATLSVAVVAGLLVAYWGWYQTAQIAEPTAEIAHVASDVPALAQTTQPQASGERTAPQAAAMNPEDVDPASIDWTDIKGRVFPGTDQMLLRLDTRVNYSEEEVAAFNKLHVIPFNPKVDEVCYDRDTGLDGVGPNFDGIVSVCDPIKQFPEHEYASLDLDSLLKLADHDAAAAVFASRKAKELALKIGMALQAVALSEKSGPLLELKERQFSSISIEGRPREEIVSDLAHRVVLERLAEVLGDPRATPDEMLPFIEAVLGDPHDIQAAMEGIDRAVDHTLQELIEIQRETTGSTHIWELVNA